jgi:hypothetical protein
MSAAIWVRPTRRLPAFIKPRITKCRLTGVWIVNTSGRRHECGPPVKRDETAFGRRNWQGALAEANSLANNLIRRELDRALPR